MGGWFEEVGRGRLLTVVRRFFNFVEGSSMLPMVFFKGNFKEIGGDP